MGFPGSSVGKESACNAGDLGSIPGLGRSPGEGNGYPLQYSGLENSMDCIDHGVTKSRIGLSDFGFHLQEEVEDTVYREGRRCKVYPRGQSCGMWSICWLKGMCQARPAM